MIKTVGLLFSMQRAREGVRVKQVIYERERILNLKKRYEDILGKIEKIKRGFGLGIIELTLKFWGIMILSWIS